MAEKVTTLRLKAVGLDDTATAVDSASRKINASMVSMEQAAKSLAKVQAAGLDTTAAEKRLGQMQERADRIVSRLGTTDVNKLLDYRAEDIKADSDKALASTKLSADQRLAIEKTTAVELADIDRQRVEIKERSEEESRAFVEKSQTEGMKLQMKLNAETFKEEERSKAELQAFVEKSAEDGLKLQAKVNAEELKQKIASEAAIRAVVEKSAQDGMKLQMQINKRAAEDARREARVQQKLDEANGGGLSGFGGKMVLGMAAGRAASDIIGDRHGGQEIGSIISGFMFGGPEIGAAIAGMELIGTAFKESHAAAEAAAAGVAEYTEAIEELSKEWSHLGTDMVKGDPFEESLKKIISGSESRSDAARSELAKVVSDDQSNLFSHYDPLNLPAALRAKEKGDAEDKNAAEARDFEKAERTNRLEDQKKIFAAEMDVTNAKNMASGPLREQAELTAKIALDHAKIEAHHREEVAQSDAALKISKEIVDQSETRANEAIARNAQFGEQIASQQAVDEAKRNLADAEDARSQMDAQHALDAAEQDQKDAAERVGAKHKKGRDLASDAYTGVVGSGQTGNRYIDFGAFDMNAKPVDPTMKSIDNYAKKIAENTDPKKKADTNSSMEERVTHSSAVIASAKHSSKDIVPDQMKHAPKGPGYAVLLAGLTDMTLGSDGLYYQQHTTGRKGPGDPTGGIGAAGLTPEQHKRLVDANIERQKPALLQKAAAGKSSIDKAWLDAQRQMDHNWIHTDQAKATGTQFKKLSPHDQFMKDYAGMDPVQRAALEAGKARLWADHHPEDDPNQVAALRAGQYAHQKAMNAARAPGMNGDPSGNGVPLWEGANQRAALAAGQDRLKSDAFHRRWGANAVMPSHLGPTGSGAITSQQIKTPEQANTERMVKLLEIIAQKIGVN